MRKFLILLLALTLFAGVAIAQDEESAHLRFMHLSSDVGVVDIYSNDEVLETEVEFGDVIDWLDVDAGEYTISVVPTRGDLADAPLETDLTVEVGDWVSVAAIGEVEKESITLQVLVEDYSPLGPFEARLSVFHAVPNYEPVNVYVNDEQLIRYLGYPGYWGPDSDGFITFDLLAQTTDIRLEQEDSTVAAELSDIVFGGQRHYFLAIAGTPTDPQFLFLSTDLPAVEEES